MIHDRYMNINVNVSHVITVVFCKTHLQIKVHSNNLGDIAKFGQW